jgi:hypothetical protein
MLEKLRAQAPTRTEAPPKELVEAQKAIAAAGGAYWFTELTVLDQAQGQKATARVDDRLIGRERARWKRLRVSLH